MDKPRGRKERGSGDNRDNRNARGGGNARGGSPRGGQDSREGDQGSAGYSGRTGYIGRAQSAGYAGRTAQGAPPRQGPRTQEQARPGQQQRPQAQPYPKAQVEPPQTVQDTDEMPLLIFGRNPVREAIKSGRAVDRIWVREAPDGSLREIIGLAKDRGLVVQNASARKLDEMCMPFGHGGRTGHHQGIVAQVPGCEYVELQTILQSAKDKGEAPFVLVLDGISDPHNLGAILRSAACFGVHGVVLPKRRAVGVTAAAMRASAGAAAVVPVSRVTNVTETLHELKRAGLWIAGADMGAEPCARAKLDGPLALVIGAEDGGISRLVRENCDLLVGIPISGPIGSLNASVAAGILMAEKRRQDGG